MEWKNTYILGTLDVTSMYTVIETAKGIDPDTFFLLEEMGILDDQTNFIVKSIQFILEHYYFI